MSVVVTNLLTREEQVFTCSPRQAVIAAHAQEQNDWNTWQYEERYGHLVKMGTYGVYCGNWGTKKDAEGDPPTTSDSSQL